MTYAGAALPTTLAILCFAGVYFWFLLHNILRGKIELYDFFVLSAVALLPAFSALFPELANELARLTGVGFPFLILDGALFAVAYYFLIRLAMLVQAERRVGRALVQEVALLRAELDLLKARSSTGTGA